MDAPQDAMADSMIRLKMIPTTLIDMAVTPDLNGCTCSVTAMLEGRCIHHIKAYFLYENGLPTRHNIAAIMRTSVPETL